MSSVGVGVFDVRESWRSEGRDGGGRTRVVDEDDVLLVGLSSEKGRRSSGRRSRLSDGSCSGLGGRGRSFGERKGGGDGGSRLLFDLDLEDHLDWRDRLPLRDDLVRLLILLLLLLPL